MAESGLGGVHGKDIYHGGLVIVEGHHSAAGEEIGHEVREGTVHRATGIQEVARHAFAQNEIVRALSGPRREHIPPDTQPWQKQPS